MGNCKILKKNSKKKEIMIKTILLTILCIAVVNSKMLQGQFAEGIEERRSLTQAAVVKLS